MSGDTRKITYTLISWKAFTLKKCMVSMPSPCSLYAKLHLSNRNVRNNQNDYQDKAVLKKWKWNQLIKVILDNSKIHRQGYILNIYNKYSMYLFPNKKRSQLHII